MCLNTRDVTSDEAGQLTEGRAGQRLKKTSGIIRVAGNMYRVLYVTIEEIFEHFRKGKWPEQAKNSVQKRCGKWYRFSSNKFKILPEMATFVLGFGVSFQKENRQHLFPTSLLNSSCHFPGSKLSLIVM
jgi:hypothetical protein